MRIFYAPDSDPMLLDTAAELNVLHLRLTEFLASAQTNIAISARVDLSPAPYDHFLPGLRLQKTQGRLCLRLAKDSWLELSGSGAYLSKYVSHFRFEPPEEDGHHHPDNEEIMAQGTLRLIVQADSIWGAENEG